MLRSASLTLFLLACLSGFSQSLCEDFEITGLYLSPYSDTTLYVQMHFTNPDDFVSYPNLRVYADPNGANTFVGEVPMQWQMIGWTGETVAQIGLEAPWSEYFTMDGSNPELHLELWSNFFSTLECEVTVDSNTFPYYPFSNDSGTSDCPGELSGTLYGTATWGQAATVHVLLERMVDGVPVDPPVLDFTESWSDVAVTYSYCLDPMACYQMTITPIEVGPDEYWLAMNANGQYYENWNWITLQGADPVVLDMSPYGNDACAVLSVDPFASNSLEIWPQPAHSEVQISGLQGGTAQVRLWSLSGQLIREERLTTSATLSVADLTSGIYVVECIQGENVLRQQLVVQH